MAYYAKNQLTHVSNATWRVWNTYDHLGRRIKKDAKYLNSAPSTRHFIYDGWNMIAETINTAAPRHYLWGLDISGTEQGAGGVGGLLGYMRGATWFIPLYDANGNIMGYVNATLGRPVVNYEFDAYGNLTSGNAISIFRHRFSTKYLDTETGLYYYGRRFYDPIWGRWINRDPIEEQGGLNLYAFCGNDGVNEIDILGRMNKPKVQCSKNDILISLRFDGSTLSAVGFSADAVSGRPILETNTSWVSAERFLGVPEYGGIERTTEYDYSEERQKLKNIGPIPKGDYWISVNEGRTPRSSPYSHIVKSSGWGSYSWTLHVEPTTETYGRSGFFVHGGDRWGSAGCIDLKHGDGRLRNFLKGLCDCYIPVEVDYATQNIQKTERYVTWHLLMF